MSFFSDLAKGFVRSAVNQVGRDGGKVISNKLYGNLHSTPIRNVFSDNDGNNFFDETTQQPISIEELNNRAQQDGFERKIPSSGYGTFSKVLCIFLGTLMTGALTTIGPVASFIPGAIFAWTIYKKYKRRNYAIISKEIEIPVFVPDRRCREGKRYIGNQMKKFEYLVPATDYEQKKVTKKCVLYSIICFFMIFIGLNWAHVSNVTPTDTPVPNKTAVNADSIVNTILNDTI